MALINKLTAIADAIRGKTGKTEEMTLDQMVTEIDGIQTGGGGDTTNEDMLLSGELTDYTNDRVKTIGNAVFYGNKTLVNVSFPNLESVTTNYVFEGCEKLKVINMPSLRILTSAGFCRNCKALELINFNSLEQGSGGEQFRNCTSLKSARLPRFKSGTVSFWDCTNLEFYDGGKELTNEESETHNTYLPDFENCANLKIVILRHKKLVPINRLTHISGTPFASGGTGGTAYVPQALIESYQTATNWSTLYAAGTCTFVAIEGSEYE